MIKRSLSIFSLADEKRIDFLELSDGGPSEPLASLTLEAVTGDNASATDIPVSLKRVENQVLVVPDDGVAIYDQALTVDQIRSAY